jgi:adenylyltransferase/sulfurtransferase
VVLKEIGGEASKLKAARVLVVGAGGFAALILYLAAAGIGEIGIIDYDRVSLDNLQRQVVHDTKHVGQAKTRSAAAAVERLNPHVATRLYSTRLVPENALAIISGYDIVADGSEISPRAISSTTRATSPRSRWCSRRLAPSTVT